MEEENKNDKIDIRDLLGIAQQQIRLQELQQQLLDKVKAGDESAVPLLVDSWEKMVVSIANNFQNKGLSMEQMIQLGRQGLTKAAQKDLGSDSKRSEFFRFGAWWARQTIVMGLANLKK